MNDFIIKDLSQRLPYNVKVEFKNEIYILRAIHATGMVVLNHTESKQIKTTQIENIKPYLIPLSNITEEQRSKLQDVVKGQRFSKNGYFNIDRIWLDEMFDIMCLLNEWHIDYNFLIEKDCAHNALIKNIYEERG